MKPKISITVLADNIVGTRETLAEHGWSVCVEWSNQRWLFDTGQGRVLSHNASASGIDLGSMTGVMLSHGHYDHTGGLVDLLQDRHSPLMLYAHPRVFDDKYHGAAKALRYIGVPPSVRRGLHTVAVDFVPTRCPVELPNGLCVTGEIPRMHPQEEDEHTFYCDQEGRDPDPLVDDQAMFLDTAKGTVVVLGCAHAGVINTLDYIQSLTGGSRIQAVIGGMHLGGVSDQRLGWTLDELQRFDMQLLAPAHCTGARSIAALWNAFPEVIHPCGTGMLFHLA